MLVDHAHDLPLPRYADEEVVVIPARMHKETGTDIIDRPDLVSPPFQETDGVSWPEIILPLAINLVALVPSVQEPAFIACRIRRVRLLLIINTTCAFIVFSFSICG